MIFVKSFRILVETLSLTALSCSLLIHRSNIENASGFSLNMIDNVGSEEEEEDNEFFDCVTDASNNPLSGMERKAGSNHSLVQMSNSTSKKNEDGTFIMKIPVSGNVGHESEESSSETEDIDNKKVCLIFLIYNNYTIN